MTFLAEGKPRVYGGKVWKCERCPVEYDDSELPERPAEEPRHLSAGCWCGLWHSAEKLDREAICGLATGRSAGGATRVGVMPALSQAGTTADTIAPAESNGQEPPCDRHCDHMICCVCRVQHIERPAEEPEHDVLCSKGQYAGDQPMPCDCDGPPAPPSAHPESADHDLDSCRQGSCGNWPGGPGGCSCACHGEPRDTSADTPSCRADHGGCFFYGSKCVFCGRRDAPAPAHPESDTEALLEECERTVERLLSTEARYPLKYEARELADRLRARREGRRGGGVSRGLVRERGE